MLSPPARFFRSSLTGMPSFEMPLKIAAGPIACRPAMMMTTFTTIARTGLRMNRSVKEDFFMRGA